MRLCSQSIIYARGCRALAAGLETGTDSSDVVVFVMLNFMKLEQLSWYMYYSWNTHCRASWNRILVSSWTRTLCVPWSNWTGLSWRWLCPLWWTRRWYRCTELAVAPDFPFQTKWPSSCPADRTDIWPCPDPRRARIHVWEDASNWTARGNNQKKKKKLIKAR